MALTTDGTKTPPSCAWRNVSFASVLIMLGQFGGGVWIISKQAAEIANLKTQVEKLDSKLDRILMERVS